MITYASVSLNSWVYHTSYGGTQKIIIIIIIIIIIVTKNDTNDDDHILMMIIIMIIIISITFGIIFVFVFKLLFPLGKGRC